MKKQHEAIVTYEEAVRIIVDSITCLDDEEIDISESCGSVLSEDIVSDINIPPLDNSAMDGYAIISSETDIATIENPVELSVIDEVKAGGEFLGKRVTEKTAIRIMTGAPVPEGADAVVQFEDTVEENINVSVLRKVTSGENIRKAGEDISRGSVALNKGDRLGSADTGLLASLNRTRIRVYRKPTVAIISTGDELVEPGEEIKPGQIRNSNYYTLLNEIKKYNSVPVYMGITKDNIENTRAMLNRAFEYDVVVTTGGISMGKYDFVADVIRDIGIQVMFEKIRMKPGKPCIFGKKGKKLYFGLPGNPVSTIVSFIQFVRPALLKMMGASKIKKPVMSAVLDNEITKKPDRLNFIRGYYSIENGKIHVNSTGPQGSGILKSMSIANCLIILPIGTEKVKKGDIVSIQLHLHDEI